MENVSQPLHVVGATLKLAFPVDPSFEPLKVTWPAYLRGSGLLTCLDFFMVQDITAATWEEHKYYLITSMLTGCTFEKQGLLIANHVGIEPVKALTANLSHVRVCRH